jgi:hypothetical protein
MGSGRAFVVRKLVCERERPLLNKMRALMDKKRRLLDKMRALMDKNGVGMERFETFRMWEFIRGHPAEGGTSPAEGGTSSAGKSAKGKNVPESSA